MYIQFSIYNTELFYYNNYYYYYEEVFKFGYLLICAGDSSILMIHPILLLL